MIHAVPFRPATSRPGARELRPWVLGGRHCTRSVRVRMQVHDGSIRVLPRSVVEKIAAGEVVERPSSVLKELIENALDAGATRIDASVDDAGFGLIRVSDNGSGMEPGDLARSVLRHATSKISSADDLFAIGTMGFRGEALAGAGAVSRLVVTSSATADGLGYRILCEGGEVSTPEPDRHTRGTTVTCRDLFYNVPARKKFMKSRRAERTAVIKTFEQIVIPFPAVHFTLTVDGQRVIDAPPGASALERVAQVAGTEFARRLLVCAAESVGKAVTLYVSAPDDATPRPRYQYLYVNLRRVDSDSVTYGVRQGFARFMTSRDRPSWFCFLEVDPKHVDVNVHPTKQKVKFDDEGGVFGFLYKAVKEGVGGHMAPTNSRSERVPAPPAPRGFVSVRETAGDSSEWAPRPAPSSEADTGVQTSLAFLSLARSEPDKGIDPEPNTTVQLQQEPWNLIACYQIHRCYILASIKNGILLIDQHAAHERILFEQALADLEGEAAESQRLLFPIVVEMSQSEKAVVVSARSQFARIGFDIQDWGGTAVAVSAIPAVGFLRESAVKESIAEMVDYLTDDRSSRFFSEPQKRFAAAYACGAAIKAGQELKQEEMNSLLNSLFAAGNPYTCPHGRPTVVRISLDELSRRFLR